MRLARWTREIFRKPERAAALQADEFSPLQEKICKCLESQRESGLDRPQSLTIKISIG